MDRQNLKFKVYTKIQIRFNDIDGLGHVNNSVYSQYFDQGRMAYFNTLNNGKPVDWHEARLIIASTQTDFLQPIFLDEQVEVQTTIYKLGNKSLKMFQQLVDSSTGAVKATCKSVMVGFNPETNEAITLPDKWRKAIEGFEGVV